MFLTQSDNLPDNLEISKELYMILTLSDNLPDNIKISEELYKFFNSIWPFTRKPRNI